MKMSFKKENSTLFSYYTFLQATMIGYAWGYFELSIFLASISCTPLSSYSLILIPLFHIGQIALPIYIALGIYHVLKSEYRTDQIFDNIWSMIAVFYSAGISICDYIHKYKSLRRSSHNNIVSQGLLAFYMSALAIAHQKIYAQPVFNKKKRFNINIYSIGDMCYSSINIILTATPIYMIIKSFVPMAAWTYLSIPLMIILFIGGILTQTTKILDPNIPPQKSISWSHPLWYASAAIAACTQITILSHIFTTALLCNPLLFYIHQLTILQPFLQKITQLILTYNTTNNDLNLILYTTTRLYYVYNIAKNDINIIFYGAEEAKILAENLVQHANNYIDTSTIIYEAKESAQTFFSQNTMPSSAR